MPNRKIQTTFAPTGNLKPAVWQGRVVGVPEQGLPRSLAPMTRMAGDDTPLNPREKHRQFRWDILTYLKDHPNSTAQELCNALGTPDARKRIEGLVARQHVVTAPHEAGKRRLNHYSLHPKYCEPKEEV